MSLVIDDSYINAMKDYVVEQSETLASIVNRYTSAMSSVAEMGFIDGETHKAIEEFIKQVESKFKEGEVTVETIGPSADVLCQRFIEDVDDLDKELY